MIRPDVFILIKKPTQQLQKTVKQDFVIPIPVHIPTVVSTSTSDLLITDAPIVNPLITTVVEVNQTPKSEVVNQSDTLPVIDSEIVTDFSVNPVEFTTIDLTKVEGEVNYVPPENLSDQQLNSLLNQMGFNENIGNEAVAQSYVENLLKKLPVYISNVTNESQTRKFSMATMRKDVVLDLTKSNAEKPEKVELTAPIAVVVNKDVDRQIIDGEIKGAGFAGPNKSYPVTSLDDVINILNKLSSSEEPKDKRVVERALKIAKRMGFLKQISKEIRSAYGFTNEDDSINSLELSTTTKCDKSVLIRHSLDANLQCFTDSDGQLMLKIPSAVIGTWQHPDYGEVVFNQKTFDEIIDNFNSDALGYEPTLNVNHIDSDGRTEGICMEIYQESDVLYADYKCNNPSIYYDVQNKRLRRSSSEVVFDYIDRRNGRSVGTTLTGMALTNTPFITGMPPVMAFNVEVGAATHFEFNYKDSINKPIEFDDSNSNLLLNTDNNMTTNSTTDPSNVIDTTLQNTDLTMDQTTKLSEDIAALKLSFETAMTAQENNFNKAINDQVTANKALADINSQLQIRIDALEKEKEDKAFSEKVAVINSLELSVEDKEHYIKLFSTKSFGSPENEQIVLNSLVKSFTKQGQTSKFTQQIGDSTSIVNEANKFVNPYQSLIERNKKTQTEVTK